MSKVFRDYDQADLDRQYDQASLVPDIASYSDNWLARSAVVRSDLAAQLDQAYGVHPREALDVFPAAAPNAPAFVAFHGGAWRGQSRKHFSIVAPPLVAAGITTVVVGFALVPAVSLSVQAHQARSALAWIYANHGRYGIDRERLLVAGHSSGGHLAMLLATTDWSEWSLPPDLVKGVVSVSGLYDLEPVRLSSRNSYLQLTEEGARRLGCVNALATLKYRPPLCIAWSTGDLPEFQRQGNEYAAACTAAGWPAECIEISGRNHFTVVEEMVDAQGALCPKMVSMARATASDREKFSA